MLPIPSNTNMNVYLKEIADICNIGKVLPTHTALHTFATMILTLEADPLYNLETARSCRCEDDTSICQNHKPKERRCRQFGKRIVRLTQLNHSIVKRYKTRLFLHLHITGLQTELGLL